jgi:hypothetical protein
VGFEQGAHSAHRACLRSFGRHCIAQQDERHLHAGTLASSAAVPVLLLLWTVASVRARSIGCACRFGVGRQGCVSSRIRAGWDVQPDKGASVVGWYIARAEIVVARLAVAFRAQRCVGSGVCTG